MTFTGFLITFIIFSIGFTILVNFVSRTEPLFKMKCRDCGERNRNWTIVPTAHDDFGWQHECRDTK